MKVAIYGAGSLGTILGAYISKAGVPIELVNRNVAHVEALNRNGATVTGTIEMNVPVNAITPDQMEGPYDAIILMTKQSDNRAIAEFLKPLLAEDGVLCTTQNGLPELKLSEILGANKVVGCTVVWGATLLEPGIARLTSEPDSMSFTIGCVGEKNLKNLNRAKDILERMCPVTIEDNFIGARWSKLLINAAFSGLSVVFGMRFGEIANNRKTRAVAQRIIKECIDVAKAAKITILPVQGKDISKLMDYSGPIKKAIGYMLIPIAMKKHRFIRSGMLGDIEKGRKTEIDSINGVVCDFGKKFGCQTPFNDKVVQLVHEMENNKHVPSLKNLHFFDVLM